MLNNGLDRFVEAQSPVYATVVAELSAGKKLTHWMWFIFPQLKVLGRSSTAKFYGIGDREEARAYLQHPILGVRLMQCAELVLAVRGKSAHETFGAPDDAKLRSCVTLFKSVAPAGSPFGQVLGRYYEGKRDDATWRLLGRLPG